MPHWLRHAISPSGSTSSNTQTHTQTYMEQVFGQGVAVVGVLPVGGISYTDPGWRSFVWSVPRRSRMICPYPTHGQGKNMTTRPRSHRERPATEGWCDCPNGCMRQPCTSGRTRRVSSRPPLEVRPSRRTNGLRATRSKQLHKRCRRVVRSGRCFAPTFYARYEFDGKLRFGRSGPDGRGPSAKVDASWTTDALEARAHNNKELEHAAALHSGWAHRPHTQHKAQPPGGVGGEGGATAPVQHPPRTRICLSGSPLSLAPAV